MKKKRKSLGHAEPLPMFFFRDHNIFTEFFPQSLSDVIIFSDEPLV